MFFVFVAPVLVSALARRTPCRPFEPVDVAAGMPAVTSALDGLPRCALALGRPCAVSVPTPAAGWLAAGDRRLRCAGSRGGAGAWRHAACGAGRRQRGCFGLGMAQTILIFAVQLQKNSAPSEQGGNAPALQLANALVTTATLAAAGAAGSARTRPCSGHPQASLAASGRWPARWQQQPRWAHAGCSRRAWHGFAAWRPTPPPACRSGGTTDRTGTQAVRLAPAEVADLTLVSISPTPATDWPPCFGNCRTAVSLDACGLGRLRQPQPSTRTASPTETRPATRTRAVTPPCPRIAL